MSWTPIYDNIRLSTIWELPPSYFKVWIAILTMKDPDGNVWCTEAALAREVGLKPSIVRKALAIFLAPDPESRSQAQEGRRLLPLSRGWFVVNHEVYQERMTRKKSTRRIPVGSELDPSWIQKRNQLGSNSASSGIPTAENQSILAPILTKKTEISSSKTEGSGSGSGDVCSRQGETDDQIQTTPAAPLDAAPPNPVSDYGDFDPKRSWEVTKEVWRKAGPYKGEGGEGDLSSAHRKFDEKISAKNWAAFSRVLDSSVGRAIETRNRQMLGVLYRFIDVNWEKKEPFAAPELPPLAVAPVLTTEDAEALRIANAEAAEAILGTKW